MRAVSQSRPALPEAVFSSDSITERDNRLPSLEGQQPVLEKSWRLPEPEGTGSPSVEAGGVLHLDQQPAGQAPAVRGVNQILAHAIQEAASDVHIEPHRNGLVVRFRVDGRMFDRFTSQPDLAPAVLSRIKILGQMNVAEHRLPQDGRFTARIKGTEFDVRISTVPGVQGEKAVLRLLPKNNQPHSLEMLGVEDENLVLLEALIQRPHGMILATGPTGSGKTTTLYAALRRINTVERNTITIEDPVEYELPRVTQIQVHPKIGLTFASGLRSVLRQDPDVVMVGEIRDTETLGIAIQAALTGHLVLSTLHCNDAASAAARCIDMGTEPFLLTSSTSAIVAQRLVRKVCTQCREQRELSPDVCMTFGIGSSGAPYFVGRGCEACRNTGYKGRTAVFEVLRMTERVKAAIHRKETSSTIRRIAMEEGMHPLSSDGVRKMLAGLTTPEEVLRSVYLAD
jgi:type II secretory ATPase GspE/PulE/Tfp pilus assembly ATPase PilB-like protein